MKNTLIISIIGGLWSGFFASFLSPFPSVMAGVAIGLTHFVVVDALNNHHAKAKE